MGFFNNIPRAEILQRANELAKEIGILDIGQSFSGSCYGTYAHNRHLYKVRISDHLANPNNESYIYDGTIDITPDTLPDMMASFERQLKALDTKNSEFKARQAQRAADRQAKEERYAPIIDEITGAGYRYFKNPRTYHNWADFIEKNPHAEYLVQSDAGNKAFKYEFLSKQNTEYGGVPPYEYLDKIKDEFVNE